MASYQQRRTIRKSSPKKQQALRSAPIFRHKVRSELSRRAGNASARPSALGLTLGHTPLAREQAKRRLLSDARAASPRLLSGTITNSRTVTSESSTYSPRSLVLSLAG